MKTVVERIKELEQFKDPGLPLFSTELLAALRDKSPTVRVSAIELIGKFSKTNLLPELLNLLDDKDAEVRVTAIETIGSFEILNFPILKVAKSLEDNNELVRTVAAEVIAEHASREVLGNLYAALDDKSSLVRSYVAEAVGSIQEEKSIGVLENRLSDERSPRARVGYYIGLIKLGKNKYLVQLLDLLLSKNYRVRCAVANSLQILALSKAEINTVKNYLKSALRNEKTIAVKSSIESTLQNLR